jgi:hypothetical protein
VTFLVQFKRFRRGVLEVTRTLHLRSIDGAAALAHARSLAGTRHWPAGTDALRVVDDNGRTLLDWRVPAATSSSSTSSPDPVPGQRTTTEPRPTLATATEPLEESRSGRAMGQHMLAAGQPVSYAEDGQPDIWKGGYEIVRLDAPSKSHNT